MAPNAKRWVAMRRQVGKLSMHIKDAFEMLIKIFHGDGTELVKEASDFHAILGMGVASILGGHEKPVRLVTVFVQFRGVVMAIPQHETDFGGDFAQQRGLVHYRRHSPGSGQPQEETRWLPRRRRHAVSSHRPSRATPIWSSGLPYQSRCGELPLPLRPSVALPP